MRYLFYSLAAESDALPAAGLPDGYTAVLWRPSDGWIRPRGTGLYPYAAFWLMHHAHLFANADYSVFLIFYADKLVHQSAITPRDFRYPFMSRDDLQIGNVFTAPEHRGRGLSVAAIRSIVRTLRAERRTFWWVTDETNAPSQRTVQRAGFHLAGTGVRRQFLRVPFFVRYCILQRADRVAEVHTGGISRA
ncbi:MAG: GNAT family N-acetyltransferase [Terriglobales bacterium]